MTIFYWFKLVVSLVAVGLLLFHIRAVRHEAVTLGRWLRYQSLLFFAVLLTGASIDKLHSDIPLNWYTVGGLAGSLVLIVAVGVSIAEERASRR